MDIFIFLAGSIVGFFLSISVYKVMQKIYDKKIRKINPLIIAVSGASFLCAYIKIGISLRFVETVILACLLVLISFIDLKVRIIPDFLVAAMLVLAIIFIITNKLSLQSGLAGMVLGGGVLFLLALLPGVMGGGDVKLMFALGLLLGLHKTVYAIVIAFILASLVSTILLVTRAIGRKDHIPFGPFLAIGSFVSFLIF